MANNTRVQFDLSPEQIAELDKLKDITELGSRKDLFNYAISMFRWAVQEAQEGHSIASLDKTEKRYKELAMPPLDVARKLKTSNG